MRRMTMKLLRRIVLLVGGIYLCQNPTILSQGYDWSQEQVQNIKKYIVESKNNKSNSQTTQLNDYLTNNSQKQSATENINQSNLESGVKWGKKNLRIYYNLEFSLNKAYVSAWHQAVTSWNNAGVVSLSSVDRAEQANIVLEVDNRSNTNQAGVTENRYTGNPLNGNQALVFATAKINMYYLDDYTYNGKVNTAEHELGHALGLQHDDDQPSVMNSSGYLYSIQQTDIDRLNGLYN